MPQHQNKKFRAKQLLQPARPDARFRPIVRGLVLTSLMIGLLVAEGCAPGPNQLAHTVNSQGALAGFWQGLWHGIIAPITFIISLFSGSVHLYEVHNNGAWYNGGFLLGACISLGGGAGRAARRSPPKIDEPPPTLRLEISTHGEPPTS